MTGKCLLVLLFVATSVATGTAWGMRFHHSPSRRPYEYASGSRNLKDPHNLHCRHRSWLADPFFSDNWNDFHENTAGLRLFDPLGSFFDYHWYDPFEDFDRLAFWDNEDRSNTYKLSDKESAFKQSQTVKNDIHGSHFSRDEGLNVKHNSKKDNDLELIKQKEKELLLKQEQERLVLEKQKKQLEAQQQKEKYNRELKEREEQQFRQEQVRQRQEQQREQAILQERSRQEIKEQEKRRFREQQERQRQERLREQAIIQERQRQGELQRRKEMEQIQQRQHGHKTEFLSLEIPGYHPGDISVSTEGHRVRIKGKHVCSCDESCLVKEFERTYALPSEVDTQSIRAILSKSGSLRIEGNKYRMPIESVDTDIITEGVGFTEERPTLANQKCLSKKRGISTMKIDRRTGKEYVPEKYENASPERTFEEENGDDDVTIEVLE